MKSYTKSSIEEVLYPSIKGINECLIKIIQKDGLNVKLKKVEMLEKTGFYKDNGYEKYIE